MGRRLSQNIIRRYGKYHFTKKLKCPSGWRTIAFALGVREPALAMMVGAQVNAQFHLISPLVLSGALTIEQFRAALAEVAAEAAASQQQTLFEHLTGQRRPPADAEGADLENKLLEADIKAGRILELVAKHGLAMRDANFFIELLDANGFTDDEIRELLCHFYPRIESLLAPITEVGAPRPMVERLLQSEVSPECARQPYLRKAIVATVGKTLIKTAEAAASQDVCNIDAIAAQAAEDCFGRLEPVGSAPLTVEASRSASEAPSAPRVQRALSVNEHPFVLGAEAFLRKAEKYGARRETNDVEAIARLFAEFLREKDVHDLRLLRQRHFAEFCDLFDELPTHWGKSSRDTCLADYRKSGAKLPKSRRGISGKTWNKHISALAQVLDSIVADGGAVGAPGELLDPRKLRAKRLPRGRGKRAQFTREDLHALFHLPVFTGCLGWARREPFIEGPHIYHRALYFAPMLLCYTGARRDEICGLCCDDVILDAPIPYIHIRPNTQRQIKNEQSDRYIPIHGEILRLGFTGYVRTIRALGYKLLFPDLHSATTASPLGDRFYDEIAGALATAVPEDGPRHKVLHSLRHTVGSALKGDGIASEVRADLLGHKGKTVTDEVYVAAAELEKLSQLIHKLPVVTEHLHSSPIRLVPWVENKQPAPWGRAQRQRAAEIT